MPKVVRPLLSESAHGTVAGRMQFRRHPGGVHVWRAPDPCGVNQQKPSDAQALVRDGYQRALAAWRSLSPDQQQVYEIGGASQAVWLCGWDYFFQQNGLFYRFQGEWLLTDDELVLETDTGQPLFV